MKKLTAILIALALPCLILAQSEITKDIPLQGVKSIALDFTWGDIIVESWDGNTVSIEGKVLINGEARPEVFEITSSIRNGRLTIESEADLEDLEQVTTIVKKDGTRIYKRKDNISIFNVAKDEAIDKVYTGTDVDASFTIKIPKSADLEINSTYGSIEINEYFEGMEINNTYGSIDARFTSLPASPEMNLTSTYSTVDVAIPNSTNAKLSMKSGYGKIFTDLDFTPDKKRQKENCPQGEDITAVLNNGAGNLSLESGYSNIYLRKSK